MNSSALNLNASLMSLEIGVLFLAVGVLLLDLWLPPENRKKLGYVAAAALGLIFVASFIWPPYHLQLNMGGVVSPLPEGAFGGSYMMDGLALFFKRFFLLAAVLVLLIAVEYSPQIASGISEFYSLILFALAGMMFAASANDFPMLFVSVELITVTFYVLVSFQRRRLVSLEAGVKYLILGALASAFMVYGIALVYGTSGTMAFSELAVRAGALADKPLFTLGMLLVVGGLAFKIATFPLQIWVPDVYQGAPTPVTAFLAVGSKAAGFVLLLRLINWTLPLPVTAPGVKLLLVISALTILYGNLCALPQRNLKRMLGYSGIASAGYLLLGVAAFSQSGALAVLYYLGGYLFTVLAAFAVISVVMRTTEAEDISSLAGLNRRSPLLAAALSLAMVSLAGIPPLAGFIGKFLLFKAAAEQGPAYYWPIGVAVGGVVISLYYYFGVIRAIYWSPGAVDESPIPVSVPFKVGLGVCIIGILYLGIYPNTVMKLAGGVVLTLTR